MLTVTSGFKTEIKKQAVYSDGKFNLKYDSTTIPFDRDDIMSMEIYGSTLQNDIVLGNNAQHSLTIIVHGDLTDDIDLSKENIIEPFFGVLVSGSYEYVQYQNFIVTEVSYSDTQKQTTLTCTDYLIKLNKQFVDTNTYPMTLKAYLESVLTYCGLSLENTSFLNSDFVITSIPVIKHKTCRELVRRVAQLALCFGAINKTNNKFQLVNAFQKFELGGTHEVLSAYTHEELSAYTHEELSSIVDARSETLSKNVYWSLKLSDHGFKTKGINTLVLKISQVDGENNTVENSANVAIDGSVELTIEDNPFISTEALRLNVINTMFSVIDGYKYFPYSVEYRGFPYLELGDIVAIEKMDSSYIVSPIFETVIKYNGGLYGKLTAKALSVAENEYKYISENENNQRGIEVIVDKVNADFTILAGKYDNGELVATGRYVFDGTGAYFYSDAFKLYDNATPTPNLKVYFDTVNSRYVFNGDIQATTGNISGNLTVGTTSINAGLSGTGTSSTSIRLWAGYATPNTAADFYVRDDGYAKIANATIAGWTVNANSIYKGAIKLDSDNERIYLNTGAYLYAGATSTRIYASGSFQASGAIVSTDLVSSGNITAIGAYDAGDPSIINSALVLRFSSGGTQYVLTRDASGFVKATTVYA